MKACVFFSHGRTGRKRNNPINTGSRGYETQKNQHSQYQPVALPNMMIYFLHIYLMGYHGPALR